MHVLSVTQVCSDRAESIPEGQNGSEISQVHTKSAECIQDIVRTQKYALGSQKYALGSQKYALGSSGIGCGK